MADIEVKLIGTGPVGPKGETGRSAYEQAVIGGYTGTEEEFNSDLSHFKDYAADAQRAAAAADESRQQAGSSAQAAAGSAAAASGSAVTAEAKAAQAAESAQDADDAKEAAQTAQAAAEAAAESVADVKSQVIDLESYRGIDLLQNVVWERGNITASGVNGTSTVRIRTKGYLTLPTDVMTGVEFTISSGFRFAAVWYAADESFLRDDYWMTEDCVILPPTGAAKLRLLVTTVPETTAVLDWAQEITARAAYRSYAKLSSLVDLMQENDTLRTLWSVQPSNHYLNSTTGQYVASTKRVTVREVIEVPYDTVLTVDDGYEFFVWYCTSADIATRVAYRDWSPDILELRKGDYINVCVREISGADVGQTDFWRLHTARFAEMPSSSAALVNPDGVSAIIQSKRRINTSRNNYLNHPEILTLLHFSDIHDGREPLARIVAFGRDMGAYINGMICTGDMVNNWNVGMAWWDSVVGAENVMLCIGNHEIRDNTSEDQAYGIHTIADAYNQYFAPYIDNWDVAYTPGLTYYYKDYPGSKIRLIVLDSVIDNSADDIAAQNDWLANALSGAKTLGYSVVCGTHYSNRANRVKIDSNFTAIDTSPLSTVLLSAYLDTVQDFIDSGGDFACWLSGHEHLDSIFYSSDYPSQIILCIGCAMISDSYGDVERETGRKSQDLFNVVSLDAYAKLIKIVRIGADRDTYMRHRGVLTIKWSDKTVVYSD